MPPCPRDEIVIPGEVGVYHCWNRCVRQGFHFGTDPLTGQSLEHRRVWIEERQQAMAGLFAVEIAFHVVMGNHLHLVLRTRPDVADRWSEEQVVRRWLTIAKLKRTGAGEAAEPTQERIAQELAKPGRVEELRGRLSSVSWFMGALSENISRRVNAEDGRSGSLWEGRFKCRRLVDETAILVCGIYVDLNRIRAGETLTPEESRYTSAWNRIQGLQQRRRKAGGDDGWTESTTGLGAATQVMPPDGWLCELTLRQGPEAGGIDEQASSSGWRASDKGLLPMSLEQYLELLDWTGRQVREDKPGSIPASLAPILERLHVRTSTWLEAVTSFDQWFGRVVGRVENVTRAAQRAGRRWFHGKRRCGTAFS